MNSTLVAGRVSAGRQFPRKEEFTKIGSHAKALIREGKEFGCSLS